jgi:inner membrane protein
VFRSTLLHPVQYVFVGFALCVFYLLLLSASEGASVFTALAVLYGFLYLLLRLEDYALLAGSVGVFIVLALVMYITRRMNWYALKLGTSR